ncbi:alpha/beta family hydrolase [Patescibacteria group bacterium]
MTTFILPGFSPRNKDWAETIQKKLTGKIKTTIFYWPHWESGQTEKGWLTKEVKKIVEGANKQKINILAKSVGTIAAMLLLKNHHQLVDKLILCGIPLSGLGPIGKKRFGVLKKFSANRVLCLQNENDPLGSFSEVETFLHSICPKIQILSKPSTNHHYPYPKDFIKHLS